MVGERRASRVYTVTTVKRWHDARSSRSTAAWATTSRSPSSDQRFEATVVNRVGGGGQPVTVVGRHCESGDVLSENVPLRDAVVGDLLAVPATGAYCYTMSNNYNGARRIPVVFVADGQFRLVVRRETWPDLLDVAPTPKIGDEACHTGTDHAHHEH